jgi:arabinose-5-phosphate isomerase
VDALVRLQASLEVGLTKPASDKAARLTKSQRPDPAALVSARRVLKLEAEGLGALATALDKNFCDAVDRLSRVKGRVVVSGIGKSGHIARKIASTFASTGTASIFVHPAEASHGDLGMITTSDALLCLSNSGETVELAHLIAHAKRFGIPLVAIVGRGDSALGGAADVVLLLPNSAEACPMGLAPTTSTTVMLALGDALAVALLERKGFTDDDFHVLHPGGRLGKSLIKVRDIMHSGDRMPLIGPSATMREALLQMTVKSFGCIGVVDAAGALIGVVTDGDLRRHIDGDLMALAVKDVMTPNPKCIRADALAAEALGHMNGTKITSLFVVDGGARSPGGPLTPVGIVHIHDCLRAGVV